MNTQIVLLALTSMAIGSTLVGCSKVEETEKTRPEKAAACRGMVDVFRSDKITAADIVDGQEGTYKLTDLRVYVETSEGEKLSYFAGRSLLPIEADPNPTPAPSATPDATPAPVAEGAPAETTPADASAPAPAPAPAKPAEPVQIVTADKIDCFDTADIQESEIHGAVEAPLAISRKDGSIPEALSFKVKAEFQQHGEKAEAVEKASKKSVTEKAAKETVSPLSEVAGTTRSFHKLNERKAFAVRIEQTAGASKQISVLVYKLAPAKP